MTKAERATGVHRIVIVDFDEDRSAAMAANLSQLDPRFAVEWFPTGRQTLWRLEREPHPTAVVIGLELPDVAGFELAERIKLAPDLPDTATIVLATSERHDGPQEGCDAYFVEADEEARASVTAFAVRLLAA
jgi:CheY-like chemotaxis protein